MTPGGLGVFYVIIIVVNLLQIYPMKSFEYKIENGTITIDENSLDLFSYHEEPIPDWEPTGDIKPFNELTRLGIDIETTGLNPENNRIMLIGIYNESGKYHVFHDEDERKMLIAFIGVLNRKKPDILEGFNHIEFDLKFIIKRCQKLRIPHPFTIAQKETTIRTAQQFGKPFTFFHIWLKYEDAPRSQHTAVIDLYPAVLQWDFVKRKLTKYTLKQSVLQMGLRKEARTELTYSQMMEEWENREENNLSLLKEYLQFDLEDTKLLADFLLPAIYYQKLFIPDWKLQSIATAGFGSKWNDILKREYSHEPLPVSDTRKHFEGGLTDSIYGFFKNVIKIDVASLYPSIMLTYGVCSSKDHRKVTLSILKYMKNKRLQAKAIANDSGASEQQKLEAENMSGAMKLFLNSKYGALGTQGIEFNDYVAGALVTAYGRKILKLMVASVEEFGAVPVSIDTDGVYMRVDEGKENECFEYVQSKLPNGIVIENELHAQAFYSPPKDTKDDDDKGLRKNYIIFYHNGKYKATGKFRKRDKSVLEKTFTPIYLQKYLVSPESAESYYQDTLKCLVFGKYPISDLSITRKIRKGEKSLVEQGLGREGDQVTIYRTNDLTLYGKRGQPLKNKKPQWTDNGECNFQPYIDMVKEQYEEIQYCLKQQGKSLNLNKTEPYEQIE
ncbi:DNA polymerase [Nostoc phage A1]|nr:DNA polymerase [Nostoc phage A1]